MPVTAIDEYYLAAPWENQVRRAGKATLVENVSIPQTMQGRSDNLLRSRVSTAHSGHKPTSLFRGQPIHNHSSVRMKSIVKQSPESDRIFRSAALE